jgi:putative mRNA 3-end processing factor
LPPTRLVQATSSGLHCEPGGFYLDPLGEVERAVLTHARADRAFPASWSYLCALPGLPLFRQALGPDASIEGVPYGEPIRVGDATVSFHPAGYVLGSAQVRIEAGGLVAVVSGAYKRAPDPTCAPFEIVRCDTFVTEAAFAMPIYRWDPPEAVAAEVLDWWDGTRKAGRPAVLFAPALGAAPRLLAELLRLTGRKVWIHAALQPFVQLYREAGVAMLPTEPVPEVAKPRAFVGELILAPSSAMGTTWIRRFPKAETGLASGAMRVRGTRRRKGVDRGFVLSDHADWPALLRTIEETGARRVLVTGGHADVLARFLREQGREAETVGPARAGEAEE